MKYAVIGLLAAATAVLLSACDPCAGLSVCGSAANHVILDGQIVRAEDGRGQNGIAVDVVRRSGVELLTDSVRVTTSGGGFFHVDVLALQAGQTALDFRVYTPRLAHPYVVSQTVNTVDKAGESVILDRWVVNPYLLAWVTAVSPSTGAPVPNATVRLIRRGDNWLTGRSVLDSVATSLTDGAGIAMLFPSLAYTTDSGAVVADVEIDEPPPDGRVIVPGMSFRPWYVYHGLGNFLQIGRQMLQYYIQVYDRATGLILAGIPYESRRVGGVSVQQDDFSGVTDQNGYVHLNYTPVDPIDTGTLYANLTLHPKNGDSEVVALQMPEYEGEIGRLLANLTIGPAYAHYIVLEDSSGKPLPGIAVRVQQTGGVNVKPSDQAMYTDDGGRAWIRPVPDSAGSSVFTLTVTPSPPLPSFKVTNLTLHTVQQDTPQGVQVWVFDLNRPLTAPPGAQISPYP